MQRIGRVDRRMDPAIEASWSRTTGAKESRGTSRSATSCRRTTIETLLAPVQPGAGQDPDDLQDLGIPGGKLIDRGRHARRRQGVPGVQGRVRRGHQPHRASCGSKWLELVEENPGLDERLGDFPIGVIDARRTASLRGCSSARSRPTLVRRKRPTTARSSDGAWRTARRTGASTRRTARAVRGRRSHRRRDALPSPTTPRVAVQRPRAGHANGCEAARARTDRSVHARRSAAARRAGS